MSQTQKTESHLKNNLNLENLICDIGKWIAIAQTGNT